MEIGALSNTVLFQKMNKNDIEELLQYLSVKEKIYQKGEVICHMGDSVQSIGIVVSGSVNIAKGDAWGNETLLAHVECGQVFAETYACVQTEPMMVEVVAAQETKIIFLHIGNLLQRKLPACGCYEQFLKNLIQVMASKNLHLSSKMSHVTPKTIRERLLSYLSYEAVKHRSREFDIPFNRQQMADYLLVERSALSKELSKMQREGMLTYRKNHFRLYEKP
ncbi:Crp/Fnr family transcriptional regulator [Mediterraneibacter sp. NSJ-55]|uniref:Crp/Fnr family transcriptional regulator n=1 Tax=Mediterraneibacter hominis TaxID=2763054 RepID=A0A923LIN9_9FIRM|nr:Crp/Fnr family transcriptional regulator [Mediterraneibacter hominis]MBC5688985.1 Crp/Fnr family transcriptional regulator [Mediterraneibacter hominis]